MRRMMEVNIMRKIEIPEWELISGGCDPELNKYKLGMIEIEASFLIDRLTCKLSLEESTSKISKPKGKEMELMLATNILEVKMLEIKIRYKIDRLKWLAKFQEIQSPVSGIGSP